MRLLTPIVFVLSQVLLATASSAGTPPPGFSKAFEPDTIGPGSVSRLVFNISNGDPTLRATDLAFSDTLPAGVAIASPANASATCGRTLTAPAGGSTISFVGDSRPGIDPGGSCTVSVDVTASAAGIYTNTSGDLTSSLGNSGPAVDDLTVATDRPGFSMAFAPSSTGLGATVKITYTVDNSANNDAITSASFSDVLSEGLTVASPANASTSCPGGSVTAEPGGSTISLARTGILPALSSCTVTVDVSADALGTFANVSGPLTSQLTFPPTNVNSGVASAELTVTASADAPVLRKSFVDDPVEPGGSVTLEFSIFNPLRSSPATQVGFIDAVDADLPGLVATSLPAGGFCGAGSRITGTNLLDVRIPSLAPGAACTFSVILSVPEGAIGGQYTNVTSRVFASLEGRLVDGDPASNWLTVDADAPLLTRAATPEPVGAGGTLTLDYTIVNRSDGQALSDLAFTDALVPPAGEPILFDPPLPPAPCGAGSTLFPIQVAGTEVLGFSGGSLAAGESCQFSVGFQVPVGTPSGSYPAPTSPLSGTLGSDPVSGRAVTDDLEVIGAPLRFTAEFIGDPVSPLDPVTLEFRLDNTSEGGDSLSEIAFSNDLTTTLAGLTAVDLPDPGFCGPGSQIIGSADLEVSGASLAAGTSCTFSVVLAVPAGALPGSYDNTTSTVAATVGGVGVLSTPASAELRIKGLVLAKSFTDDPVRPGDTVSLEYTLENQSTTLDASSIIFTDNLAQTLNGLVIEPDSFPTNPCGGQLVQSSNSFLIFQGGTVLANGSCTFGATLQVPAGAEPNTYSSPTSALTAVMGGGSITFEPGSDPLTVAFAPNDPCDEPTLAGGEGPLPRLDEVDTLLATPDDGDPTPSCGMGRDGATVWYSLVPQRSGTYRIDTSGSSYDTVVSVWLDSEGCGSLETEVGCNDDDGERLQSFLEFEANSAITYLVQVGARNMGEGGDLFVRIPEPGLLWQSLGALAVLGILRRRRGPR